MRLAIKLAYRNLIKSGLRTWLSVFVLSFSYVIIIWIQGIMIGWDHQGKTDMTNFEIAGGQYWQETYDPFDPLTLDVSNAPIPPEFLAEIEAGDMEPILIIPGHIFPQGRMQAINIRGIRTEQTLWKLPTEKLDTLTDAIPAFIGYFMAKTSRLKPGDRITLRWRDAHGTFDADEIVIVSIFSSNVPGIESGQVYIPLKKLEELTLLQGRATMLTFRDPQAPRLEVEGWILKSREVLTKQLDDLIKTKTIGQIVLYSILLLLALLAIFDTQVLSIFRRQKEIGTYIALGYTRREVVGLFTVEGSMNAVLAAFMATIYGLPFLYWQAKVGWTLPVEAGEFGMAMAQTLYPIYTIGLVVATILLILITTTIVSYLPSRKIAKMNPTEALRGKLQ